MYIACLVVTVVTLLIAVTVFTIVVGITGFNVFVSDYLILTFRSMTIRTCLRHLGAPGQANVLMPLQSIGFKSFWPTTG
jgi:hypothetical protein